jgi:hypothetical protein
MEVIVKDQTFSGEVLDEIRLKIEKEIVTVKDIIEHRVIHEVERYNRDIGDYFKGLVQPTDSEKELNSYKMKKRKVIDPEKQVYIALEAYNNNGFFVLIDHVQVESLDTQILFENASTVSFVKLTQLVGG